ncbi:Lipoprotein signal peptidase [Populus alba x Populus x berolinensis]|uniref:Lipoprotein signal peptidase n=1 Tax=Populus alba x Populus x berolinensis TaxID=444605 RepID=A0AAD6W2G3_9ROSI|nr:Lipoprotein signal peptidase [Populus alba x Populus x berolinensis]
MARSMWGWSSRTDRGMLRERACSSVRLEVGTPMMSFSSPVFKSSPSLATTKAAVEPVPRPRTMPDLTYSTALSAASFLRSSWVRTGADWALMEEILVRVRRFRDGVRRVRRDEEGVV